MIKNIFKKISTSQVFLFFIFSLIFCVLLFFNHYWITNACDDTCDIARFPEKVYHGKYIVSLLLNLIYGGIPLLFDNIHINTWGQTGGAVAYSIFVIILITTLSSLFFIKNKKIIYTQLLYY